MRSLVLLAVVIILGNVVLGQESSSKWALTYSVSPEYTLMQFDAGNAAPWHAFYAQSNQVNPNRRTKLNPGAGIGLEYRVTNRIRLNGGLLYSARGVKYKEAASTVNNFQVYTSLVRSTEHYYGVPLNASIDWKRYQKVRFFSTLGVDFNFQFLRSVFERTRLVSHAADYTAITTSQGMETFGLDFLTDQNVNIFSPAVRISTGVEVNVKTETRFRIAPTFRWGIRRYSNFFVSHYFHNLGVTFSLVKEL